MVAVFFAYQALEAFCNDEIFRKAPEHINIKIKINETLTRREAERKLSTREKLGTSLPAILGVPAIKGTAQWQSYCELESVRNDVVHLKNQTVRSVSGGAESEKVLFTLLSNDLVRWPRSARDILSYFVLEPEPDWFAEIKHRVI